MRPQNMDSAVLATPPSESDTSTTLGSSGKIELTKDYVFAFHEDESVKELSCTGVLEFIPGKERDGFMDQCYRILVPEGKMTITVPYWSSWRAYYDPRTEWPPFNEQSFLRYNKSWREENKTNSDLQCDFDFTYGYAWDAETQARNDESRAFWTKHYTNSVDALQLMLTKRP
jgi:hypothetical protein